MRRAGSFCVVYQPKFVEGISAAGEPVLLKEELESELIVLRRGEPAIDQVIEPDQEPASVGTQGCADDGAGESADDGAKDKRPDARGRRRLGAGFLQIARRVGCLVDVSQHLLMLPKSRRRSPSTHWMASSVGASAQRSSSR